MDEGKWLCIGSHEEAVGLEFGAISEQLCKPCKRHCCFNNLNGAALFVYCGLWRML